MGKQINFYMCSNIQEEFIEYLYQNHFVFLDSNSDIVNYPLSESVFCMYLYKEDYGEIVMRQDNKASMDTIKSPVIQFNKTIIRTEQKKILRGRLWISERYNDYVGNLVKKKGILIKDYQMLTRWIKKYVPHQEIKKGEYLISEYVNDELKVLQEEGYIFTI